MNTKKKLLFTSLIALMCLTGCRVDEGGGDVDRTLPTDDPSELKEIHFWHCLGHDKCEVIRRIVNDFNEEYDGKYKVVLDHVGGDYTDLDESVKTKLTAGEIPALTMGYPDSFSTYMTTSIENSNILRLDNFINDPNYGYSQADIDDFVDEYYAEGTSYQLEGTWSMPLYKSTEVMYYNKSYFDGVNPANTNKFTNDSTLKTTFLNLYNKVVGKGTIAGTTLKTDLAALRSFCEANGGYVYDVPTTWDGMFALAAQMRTDLINEGGEQAAAGFYPVGYDSDANLMISQFAQRGIPYTVNDEASKEDPTKHFVFNNPEAKAFVADLKTKIDNKLLITKNTLGGTQYTNEYFTALKTVMTIGSTGGSAYNISANFLVDIARVPSYDENEENIKYIQQGPSICFFNNDDDYIHKGAWLFYKKLAEPENNCGVALENSYDPIRKSCYSEDPESTYGDWIAQKDFGLKYQVPTLTKEIKKYFFTSPTFMGSGTARSEIGNIITYVIRNKASIDNAFETALNVCKASVDYE